MAERLFGIVINSTEENKDLGFEVLDDSELPIIYLEDENYMIPESGIKLLRDRGVMYDVITINGVKVNG